MGGSKINEIQQEEAVLNVKYAKTILLTPIYLCMKLLYNFVLGILGFSNNIYILFTGKRSEKFSQKIRNFAHLDYFVGQIILFKTDQSFSERNNIVEEELNQESNEEQRSRRIIILERLGGSILFFQTRIIYMIFLLVNWISFLLVTMFKKTSNSINAFISNSLEEIHHTNLYLAGVEDERVRWNSLDDPIIGVFYPLLTHGFVFCYFLLYGFLAILRLAGNPVDLIAYGNSFAPGEIIHIVVIALIFYFSFFLFLIPYYLHYPDKIKDKKLVQIWKEIGFTIRYPLRDLFVLVLFVGSYLLLDYNIIGEIVSTGTIDFNTSILMNYLAIGFFWSIAEEITFRGYVIMGLERKANSIVAIIVSSSLFGFYHAFQSFPYIMFGYNVLNALLFGIFLAFIRVKTKSFIIPFIIHVFDYIFFKGTFSTYQKLIPLSGERYYFTLLLLIFTIMIILVLLIYPKDSKKKNEIESLNGSL